MRKKLIVILVIVAVAAGLLFIGLRYGGLMYTNISQMLTFSKTGNTTAHKVRFNDNTSGQRGFPAGGYWFGSVPPHHESAKSSFTIWNEGTETTQIRMQIENCQQPLNDFHFSDQAGTDLGKEMGFLLAQRQTIQTGRTIYVTFAPQDGILYVCSLDIYQVNPSGEEQLEQVPLTGSGM